jgi:16S rRNA (guanine527-N7)-methyltransferase
MEELIFKYFPNLPPYQKQQFSALYPLYEEWNSKINVISRKDISNLYLHHILHSLSIAKFIEFPAGASVLDIGTGGGFPGIPLAILFPDVSFHLCDSIGKKITVAREIASALKLKNIIAEQVRAEDISKKFDFVVSRAVAELSSLLGWAGKSLMTGNYAGRERGMISLKGGDLKNEIMSAEKALNVKLDNIVIVHVGEWFQEPYFDGKYLIFIGSQNINICR